MIRPRAGPGRLVRFDAVERTLHWVTAGLFAILVLTGAALYFQPIGALVGRRDLVQDIHVYFGLALPVPLLASVAGPWGRGLRADLRRLNRWTKDDRLWLRALASPWPLRLKRRSATVVGKFNAGQKLNAAWTAGAGLLTLLTGVIMRWYHPWPLAWRTGATFVHDWLALGIGVVIVGHVFKALSEPEVLRSMITGRVSRSWAARRAPAWSAGDDGPPPADV